MELKDYREKMDAIDDQLLPLFLQRMEVAAEIAAWKKDNGIPVLDAGRERAKLRELEEKTPEALRDYTDSLYQTIFELSRSSQTRLLGVTSPLTEAIEKALTDTPQLFPAAVSQAGGGGLPGGGGGLLPAGLRPALPPSQRLLLRQLRGRLHRH